MSERGHYLVLQRSTDSINEMLDALSNGASVTAAASFARLSPSTVHGWVSKGQDLLEQFEGSDDEPLHHERLLMELAVNVEQSIASVEIKGVRAITDAGDDGDWRAYAWLLERRFRDRWSQRVESTGAGGGPVEVDVKQQRQQVEAALSELSGRLAQIESGDEEDYRVEAEVVPDEDDEEPGESRAS